MQFRVLFEGNRHKEDEQLKNSRALGLIEIFDDQKSMAYTEVYDNNWVRILLLSSDDDIKEQVMSLLSEIILNNSNVLVLDHEEFVFVPNAYRHLVGYLSLRDYPILTNEELSFLDAEEFGKLNISPEIMVR